MQHVRRRFPLALFGLLALLAAAPARAADDDPKAFLEGVYAHYLGKEANGLDFSDVEGFSRTFDPTLTGLYRKDLAESDGEVGRLDVDPLLGTQDFEVTAIQVTIDPAADGTTTPDKARATVTLTDFGQPRVVKVDLLKTKDGWRIADVHWAGGGSLLASLSAPPE